MTLADSNNTLLWLTSGCGAHAKVSPRSGNRFDAYQMFCTYRRSTENAQTFLNRTAIQKPAPPGLSRTALVSPAYQSDEA
jgi:hypothetical protein